MADEAGQLIVRIAADLSDLKAGLDKVNQQVGNLGVSTVAKGNLISDAFKKMGQKAWDFAQTSIHAFGEHEQIMVRLTNAVGKNAAKAFEDLASSLQKVTTFNDEAILSLQAQLANFGVLPGSIEDATRAALDYASATGTDLPAAGTLLAQAMAGQGRELKKLGLDLSTNASRSDNLAKTVDFLKGKFGGMAEQLKSTTLGEFENFKNRMEELKELIGGELIYAIEKWSGWIDKAVDKLKQLTGISFKASTAAEQRIKLLEQEKKALQEHLKELGYVTEGQAKASRDRLVSINAQIKALKEQKPAEEKITKALKDQKGAVEEVTDAGQERIDQLEKQVRSEGQVARNITRITELEYQQRTAAARNSFQAQASFSQALTSKLITDTMSWGSVFANVVTGIRDSFASGMADVIVNGGSFAEKFKEIGRNILQYFVEEVIKKMVTAWLLGMAGMQSGPGAGGALGSLFGGLLGAGGAGTAGVAPGGLGIMGPLGGALLGNALGFGAGSLLGGHLFGENSNQGGANLGAGIGTLLMGPLGGVMGGVVGGGVNSIKTNVKNLGKKLKKSFSGGVIAEESVILGMRSGSVGVAGEDGPEGLVSFKDDLGISPGEGKRRLLGRGGGGGGGGGMQVVINIKGAFLDGDPAMWDKLVREHIITPLQRYRRKTLESTI